MGYEATTLKLICGLKQCFPQHALEIDLNIAGELIFSEDKELRLQAITIVDGALQQQVTPEQESRLKKIIHDASCNSSNYEHHEVALTNSPNFMFCLFNRNRFAGLGVL
jgi:hypothetical protein